MMVDSHYFIKRDENIFILNPYSSRCMLVPRTFNVQAYPDIDLPRIDHDPYSLPRH